MSETAGASPVAHGLVGRDAELGALQDAWSTGGSVRVVRGQAGIGKSRLVRELAAGASAQGGLVLAGRATPSSSATPLRPLREALLAGARRGLQPGDDLAPFRPALAAVVPEWGSATEAGAVESSLLLGEAILRLLSAAARDRTAVLVVDDLQWADPETLAVVEYLADNLEGTPVLLVLLVRDGEPGPGTDLAAALVARRAAVELRLRPLADDDVMALARASLGDEEIPAEVVAALVARTEGVPFLVEELMVTAASAGWESVEASVPGSVVSSVELRLERLPAEARPLLTAAAVLGRLFDWSLAARTVGMAEQDAAELLRLGVRAQLVDVEGAGFRFRHALTRDAVLVAATPAERARLSAAALELLLADGDPVGEPLLLAAELAEATDPARAATLLTAAARQAVVGGALVSADHFATRAVALSGADPTPALALLEVLVLQGDTARARTTGEGLLALDLPVTMEADVLLHLAAAALTAGDLDDAEARVAAAKPLVDDDPARHARLEGIAAHVALERDDVEEAIARAQVALAAAEDADEWRVQCEALEVIGRAERGRDVAAAGVAFERALDIATAYDLGVWRVRALQELGTIDMYETLKVERLLEAREVATTVGALAMVAILDLQLAAIYDERGELDLSLQAGLLGEQAARRWKLSTLPMCLVMQGMVHARRGDRAEMERTIAAARATGADVDYVEGGIGGNVEAIFHIGQGDLVAAQASLDRVMEIVRRRPALVVPVPGLWALVRTLRDDGGDAAREEVRALPFDTPVSRRMLAAADGVALGQAGDRAGATARLEDCQKWLDGIGGGFRYSFIRLLVAPAAARDGWGEPAVWLRESCASFEAMGLDGFANRCRDELKAMGEPVPRRSRAEEASPVPPSLAGLGVTAREIEVLALVATGATNREIAERLFISVRTVDKHVERLLQKSGVSSRQALATVAADAGLPVP